VRLLKELQGVVEAPIERVAPVVLVAPVAPGVTVAVDHAAGMLSVQGGWWYRGETTVRPHPRGTLVTYRILDIAPQGRWATWLVSRRPLRDVHENQMDQDNRLATSGSYHMLFDIVGNEEFVCGRGVA